MSNGYFLVLSHDQIYSKSGRWSRFLNFGTSFRQIDASLIKRALMQSINILDIVTDRRLWIISKILISAPFSFLIEKEIIK